MLFQQLWTWMGKCFWKRSLEGAWWKMASNGAFSSTVLPTGGSLEEGGRHLEAELMCATRAGGEGGAPLSCARSRAAGVRGGEGSPEREPERGRSRSGFCAANDSTLRFPCERKWEWEWIPQRQW